MIFISYPTEDAVIADRIMAAIKALPSGRFEPFLDRVFIKGGQKIPNVIHDALRRTIYFVAIGTDVTRRNFDWCGQELGFYQGSNDSPDRKETCIYHSTIPDIFAGVKCFRVQSVKNEHKEEFGDPMVSGTSSEIYHFLLNIAELNADLHPPLDAVEYWKDVPKWAEKWSLRITDGFFTALQNRVKNEWYPQGRIEISIEDGDFYKSSIPEIPATSDILLSGSIYNIFSLAIPSTIRKQTWGSFLELLKEASGSDILARVVSDIIISALPARAEAKNDYVIQAPNQKYYRVILVKHNVYGNKRREFVINLIETLNKVRGGEKRTTILVAGIVIGSKYRSLFHEPGAKYEMEKLSSLAVEDLAVQVDQILHDIERINADAASDGLADYTALQDILEQDSRVKDLFEKWWSVFPPMEASAKAFLNHRSDVNRVEFLNQYKVFLDMSRGNNSKFLKMCLESYSHTIT